MYKVRISFAIIVVSTVWLWYYISNEALPAARPRPFPDGFLFGVATSAYQIEGAWNEDGKSENIWDARTHLNACATVDCSNADIAADSYHLYKRDVQMLRELGVDHYRFSFSWTRLLPTGSADEINAAGVNFYNNYINEMIKYNITPMVTLLHGDIPQRLEELGGSLSPHIFGDWFADYARVAFRLFGDRVKFWMTVNEPEFQCIHDTKDTMKKHLRAGNTTHVLTEYSKCFRNILMAHARAWHIYDEEFRSSQRGNISIVLSLAWHESLNKHSKRDIDVATKINEIYFSIADPIFSESGGGFPPAALQNLAAKSAGRGYVASSEYDITEEERNYIRGTSDYFGLIHYYTGFISNTTYINNVTYWNLFDGLPNFDCQEWNIGGTVFIVQSTYTPWGFYKVLMKIREDYNNWPVFVLENGFKSKAGLHDAARVTHLRGYLAAMLDAMDEGVDVRSYTVWSLMDSFEWASGYTTKFGLYEVDMADPGRARRPRSSAFAYKHILRTRSLAPRPPPGTRAMTIDPGH